MFVDVDCARKQEFDSSSEYSSPYFSYRREIVQFVAKVCSKFKLKTLTIHYAMNYLDRFVRAINMKSSDKSRYFVFAAASLMIAAKFEERPDHVPYVQELFLLPELRGFDHSEVSSSELMILKGLGWKLHVCTYVHMLDSHISTGICSTTEEASVDDISRRNLVKYIYFFADLCLLNCKYSDLPVGHVVSSIIGAARLSVQLQPWWPTSLEETLSFREKDIEACTHMILNDFLLQWPDWFPQHLRGWKAAVASTPCRVPCREERESLDAMHIDEEGYKKNLLQEMERDVEEDGEAAMLVAPLPLSSKLKDGSQLLVL